MKKKFVNIYPEQVSTSITSFFHCSVKERFSKAAVNTMKTALSGIPDDEKKAMSKKALADLKVYDDAYVQMESHHIPGKKTKLEFHLVDDMVIWVVKFPSE